MNDAEQTQLRVRDIGEAAALHLHGFPLLFLAPRPGNPANRDFIFGQYAEGNTVELATAADTLLKYRSCKLPVDGYSYYLEVKAMKHRMQTSLQEDPEKVIRVGD